MTLEEILRKIGPVEANGDLSRPVTGISYDSRKAGEGHLFVAVKGEKFDGHDFIDDAVGKGAVCVICERPADEVGRRHRGVIFVQVRDSREALARAAAAFFGDPSRTIRVVGITGTNGKTTTSYLIKSILEAWGRKTGLIGTIQYMIGQEVFPALHTTPEALEYQGLLRDMIAAGCTYAVSEVSSHSLAQKRVEGTLFRAAVLTNLTRDHLDFHGTMEAYFASKKHLFYELLDREGSAIINADDPYGRRLSGGLSASETQMAILTYGLETVADLTAGDINNSSRGLEFKVSFRGRKYPVTSTLLGLPNVYNILSAAATAASLGVPWEVILAGIRSADRVRGRFERVEAGQRFLAVIDFAHTEDALERLIYTARGLTAGKIITVFGCGGDRDKGKRPAMGSIATRLSDFVIITSDNPRSENPEDIIAGICSGAARRNYLVEADRREAIRRAVLMASENDIVLVAGKGHENYQEIKGRRYPFSDREVLEETIKQLIGNR